MSTHKTLKKLTTKVATEQASHPKPLMVDVSKTMHSIAIDKIAKKKVAIIDRVPTALATAATAAIAKRSTKRIIHITSKTSQPGFNHF